ncbi:sugar transferase [Actinoallomurus acaciae]|uniref:Sugar transferase n=1 Tax=Actinoallomurus acaciae TaxID=502577 RepID=A0ABV5YN65_9ACTN
MAARPFGRDDLGRSLFEGDGRSPGFAGMRDDLLHDLAATVNLLRGMGAGLVDAGGRYIETDGAIVDELGVQRRPPPPSPGRPALLREYRPPTGPDGLPSTVPAPGVVRAAKWFFEAVGLGYAWPDGDLGGMETLRDTATAMALVVDQVTADVAAHAGRVTGSGSGIGTDAFGSAARVVHGKDGLLEELKSRCNRLAEYCQTSADATVKARWHFVASATFVLALIAAASLFGPLSETVLTPLIRLEGLALRVILLMIREAALGAAFTGGLDVIDQLFRTGTVDPAELAGALWQGTVAGGLMGSTHASLPALLRRAPALTSLVDAVESPGWKGIAPRFVTGGAAATVATAAAGQASGGGWDWRHAAENGFGMAFVGAGAEAVRGTFGRHRGSTEMAADSPADKIGPYWLNSPEKRRQDIKLAMTLGPVAGVPVVAGASLKFFEDRKTPFFSQWRVGKGGVPFRIHKLRTMSSSTSMDASLGSGDPRATKIGKLLRKFTIDELPQLANILKGEMSLVGPRPLLAGDIETMARVLGPDRFREWYAAYTGSRPGLISMFGNESVHLAPQTEAYLRRRAELDIEYFHNASPELDRKIVHATLNVGLTFVGRRPAPSDAAPPPDASDLPGHGGTAAHADPPDGVRRSSIPGGRVFARCSEAEGDRPTAASAENVPGDGARTPHHGGLPDRPPLPADVKQWWDMLTPDRQRTLSHEHRADIGALDGIPIVIRDRANRAALAEQETRLVEERDRILASARPGDAGRLRDLEDRSNGILAVRERLAAPTSAEHPRPYLLALDTEGTGRVVIAFGNPDTAANVATYVPGAKARLGNAEAHMRVADAIARSARRAGSPSTAVVAWVGYPAPQTLVGAASRRFADAAAPHLHRFQDGLRVTHQGPRSHNTVIGYSYGSVVIGHAARDGVLNADDVVFTAGPGVGAAHADRLRLTAVPRRDTSYYVHATIARWDFIRALGLHGPQPAGRRFGATTFRSAPGTRGPWYLGGLSREAHREYWTSDTPTLARIGEIVSGRSPHRARP